MRRPLVLIALGAASALGCWSLLDLDYHPAPADAAADASPPDATASEASVLCAKGACAAPAEACCLVWLQADYCVPGAAQTCASDSGAATSIERCDDVSDCAAGLMCCGQSIAGPPPYRSDCLAEADCAARGGHPMCLDDAGCDGGRACALMSGSSYRWCE
jgi:hypothetical protein